MKYSAPRGTKDILPAEAPLWQKVESVCRQVFETYNYSEIRTPAFESTDLFVRSIGKTTEIIGKEMFNLEKEALSLRPEATAPAVRAALQGGLLGKGHLVKLYYLGPMFRKERPQAGRLRQFHQAGVEAFGSADPALDAEVILLTLNIIQTLVTCLPAGTVGHWSLVISSLGCKDDKEKYKEELKKYFKDKAKKMCPDCQGRYKVNPLRILDCKTEKCQEYINEAPATLDYLCGSCKEHFDRVTGILGDRGIGYQLNKRLVRGLDYYTGTTFEIKVPGLGAQNAIAGGGRYDNLVEELGGVPTPGVGMAIGLDRLILALGGGEGSPRLNVSVPSLKVYFAVLGEAAKQKGFELLNDLRAKSIKCDMDFIGRSLKGQMREADRLGAESVYIIGDNELAKNTAVLKNMKTGEQKEISFETLAQLR